MTERILLANPPTTRCGKTTAYNLAGVQRNRFNELHFAPYARSIGSLLLAWNDLHESLSTLFVMAMGLHQFARSFALWHETRNDVGKRRLLRAAINNLPTSEIGSRTTVVKDIAWILKIAGELEGFRDDSAHTPVCYTWSNSPTLVQLLANPNIDLGVRNVIPHTRFANPRALRLAKNKQDMLVEYRYARERILVLRDYAIAIDAAWANSRLPWPDRPDLPERKPSRRSKAKASRRRQK
jgi:hypothetical protein